MDLKSFIKKPVLSSVISILIVIMGVIAYKALPIEQYPDIAPPQVNISTYYYGASAQTIMKAVIMPLEESINGVENMMYMCSTASNSGEVSIDVYFKQGVDPDMATVNVQNRVTQVMNKLPQEVQKNGVTVNKQMNAMLQVFTLSSPDNTYDERFIANYLNINLKPKIMRIAGVGKFVMFGAEYSMRVWLDPAKMASLHLDPNEVITAIQQQNAEAATGVFGENTTEQMQYPMVFSGRLSTLGEFENIVVKATDKGEVLRLKDIARIELGTEHNAFRSSMNRHPGTMGIVYQTAGSNAKVVNEQIEALLKEEKASMPEGLTFTTLMNTNDFLNASMNEVVKTLLEALALVIIIVLLFLHDWQSTLIPFVGIFVSLIGTFAFMQAVGFTINLISLFALVLVIGTVVDDSIVVVEAVHEKLESGYKSSLKASIDAMSEITGAVVTSSLVFMAVFIPVSMMGGTSGVFFRQFGLTMAVAVGISAINALTLSPALCAILLKPFEKEDTKPSFYQRLCTAFDTAFVTWSIKYKNGILPFVKRPWIPFGILILSSILLVWTMAVTPKGFVPQEDKGFLMCDVLLPSGSSLYATEQAMKQISAEIEKIEEVESVGMTAGYGMTAGRASNAGFYAIRLKDWEEREFLSINTVIEKIYAEIGVKYPDIQLMPFQMPMIPGYGSSADAEIQFQDKTDADLLVFNKNAHEFMDSLSRDPRVGNVYTTFLVDEPQWLVNVNTVRCLEAGLTQDYVLNVLATYMSGQYTNDVNLYGKVYKVMVQGESETHRTEHSLQTMMVRTSTGAMAPLSQFITLQRQYGSASLRRFQMMNAIQLGAQPAVGASSGDLIQACRETAQRVLNTDCTFEFGGMTREESNGGSMGIIFAVSALLIYLLLSCLYESYVLPLSVLFSVPMGVMGAFFATWLVAKMGMPINNNIYLQTGVVMMIGLLSKTGILITEFAVQKREQGMSIQDAALEAAKARLRPIMMTAGTMVIGLLPLLTSTGVGALGNISLGVGTVFGMLIGCVGLLFLVPAFFVVFQKLQEKIKPIEFSTNDQENESQQAE